MMQLMIRTELTTAPQVITTVQVQDIACRRGELSVVVAHTMIRQGKFVSLMHVILVVRLGVSMTLSQDIVSGILTLVVHIIIAMTGATIVVC